MTMFNRRDIPHPYLYPANQDYEAPASFSAQAKVTRDSEANRYHVGIIYELNEQAIQGLIDTQRASFTAVIDCFTSRLRETYQSQGAIQEIILQGDRYKGTVTINPFITATTDLEKFKSKGWSTWLTTVLPDGTNIPAGAILAAAQVHTFNTDGATEMESCLKIVPSDHMEPGQYKIELEDLIHIVVNTNDKPQIDRLRQNQNTQDQLWPSLYLPAIAQAIQGLLHQDNADKTWAKTLAIKLAENEIQIDDHDLLRDNALRYAQQLMDNPLGRLLKEPQEKEPADE